MPPISLGAFAILYFGVSLMGQPLSKSELGAESQPIDFPKPHKGGLILFGSFVLLYSVFVGANAVIPDSMGHEVLPGINYAVAGGVGIIFATFLIAAIYSWIRRNKSRTGTDGAQS